MSADLLAQLQDFARVHGGKIRTGPQPRKPAPEPGSCIGRTQPVQRPPKADPWLEYTDDYSVWKQGQ
ncbi:hypothetical protein UFOVP348_7 [uncultured Caudovirales phage]|uniref:Uncharacterized protein n=1 Tax=uncultured Caudovirales phage TaxID=2100421 RepID=A0A6J5M1G0_9CAUD|nr:hypothetical protein UFOVP348_7 [uncultured Caudovirales phage]